MSDSLIEEAREYLKRYESNYCTPDTLDGLVRRLSDALGRSEALLEKAERERDEATMAEREKVVTYLGRRAAWLKRERKAGGSPELSAITRTRTRASRG